MARGGTRKGAGRKPANEALAMVSLKLRRDEADELRELAAKLKITQADVMRMGIAVARKKASR